MPTVADMTPFNDVNLTGPMALRDDKFAWLDEAAAVIAALADDSARTGSTFTADDLRAKLGEPGDANWAGIAFASARNAKLIELDGFAASTSKSRNGGVLRVWRAKT